MLHDNVYLLVDRQSNENFAELRLEPDRRRSPASTTTSSATGLIGVLTTSPRQGSMARGSSHLRP